MTPIEIANNESGNPISGAAVNTYRVEIESETKPSVCVDIEQDDEPTEEQILEALEDLAQQMTYEGYVAEYIVTEGGDWRVNVIEKYPA